MRSARVTFKGAYHHIMNRGIEGKNIFLDDNLKGYFLKLLKEKSIKMKMRVFAYCLMNNHYHLILQNSSDKLSNFMRQLNGQYGINYRKKNGGSGHVFQNRYKSTLIQKGSYLRMSIIYVLLNPVRANIVENPHEYKWSSIGEYFNNKEGNIVDSDFVEDIIQSEETLEGLLGEWVGRELPIKRTRFGKILGGEDFKEEALRKFDRRAKKGESIRMRKDDYTFKSPDEVIKEFENEKDIEINMIDTNTLEGKHLRSELIVLLKDKAGMKYKDMMRIPFFKSLKYSSLGKLYQRAREKMYGEI